MQTNEDAYEIHERSLTLKRIYEEDGKRDQTVKVESDSLNAKAIALLHLDAFSEHGLRRLPDALIRLEKDGKIMPLSESLLWLEFHLERIPKANGRETDGEGEGKDTMRSFTISRGTSTLQKNLTEQYVEATRKGVNGMLASGKLAEVAQAAKNGQAKALLAVALLLRQAWTMPGSALGQGMIGENQLPKESQSWASLFIRACAAEDLSAAWFELARELHFKKDANLDWASAYYYMSATSGDGTPSVLSLYALHDILSSTNDQEATAQRYKELASQLLLDGQPISRASKTGNESEAPVPLQLLRVAKSPQSLLDNFSMQWKGSEEASELGPALDGLIRFAATYKSTSTSSAKSKPFDKELPPPPESSDKSLNQQMSNLRVAPPPPSGMAPPPPLNHQSASRIPPQQTGSPNVTPNKPAAEAMTPVNPVTPELAQLLVMGQNYEMGLNGFQEDLFRALETYEAAGDNPFALFRRYTITFRLKLMYPGNIELEQSYKVLHFKAIVSGSLQACSDWGVALRYTILALSKQRNQQTLPHQASPSSYSSGSTRPSIRDVSLPLDAVWFGTLLQCLQWIERHMDRDPTFSTTSARVNTEGYQPTIKMLSAKAKESAANLTALAKRYQYPTTQQTDPEENEGAALALVWLGHLLKFLGIKEVYPGFFFAGASGGIASAMYEVARGYQFGSPLTPPDLLLACCWYHEAARRALSTGDLHIAALSLVHLADLYTFGIPSLEIPPNQSVVQVYRASALEVMETIRRLTPSTSRAVQPNQFRTLPGLFDVRFDANIMAPLPTGLNVEKVLAKERKTTIVEVSTHLLKLLDSILEGVMVMKIRQEK
ncbi:hypothetical protein HDU97_007920 [Phlyctochytrium planicorne]|nr:hypothetical protein HDU97_007920 [Phlyctochytrium planicorne]